MRELNECEIDCEAAKALAVWLEGNTILKTMNLWDNRLGKEGAIALAEAIKMNNETQLETLNLWGTNKIGNEGAMAFAELLTTNNSLRDLILVYNEIGERGVEMNWWMLLNRMRDYGILICLIIRWTRRLLRMCIV